MASKIEIQKRCEYCNEIFTAKTTVTKYCSHKCNQRGYKAKKRDEKIQIAKTDIIKKEAEPIEMIKAKEFLTAKEAAILLGLSVRTVYRLIDNGKLKSVNLAERLTRIKKSELNKLID